MNRFALVVLISIMATAPCFAISLLNVHWRAHYLEGNPNEEIDIGDVGPFYRHEQNEPIEVNALYGFGDQDFRFSVSDSRIPVEMRADE